MRCHIWTCGPHILLRLARLGNSGIAGKLAFLSASAYICEIYTFYYTPKCKASVLLDGLTQTKKQMPYKISNAPQVCCLSTRLGGLLCLVKNFYFCFAKVERIFKTPKLYLTFHKGCFSQSLGNPIKWVFTIGYSSNSFINLSLNFVFGLTVCSIYNIVQRK